MSFSRYANNDPVNKSDPNGHAANNGNGYSSQVGSRSVTSFLGDFLGSIFGQNPTSRQSDKALAQRSDNAVRDTAKTAASIAAQQTGVPDIIEGVKKRDYLQVGVGLLTMGSLIVPEAKAVTAGIRVAATETRFVAGVSIIDRATNKVIVGTTDLKPTLDRIAAGIRNPHARDGSTFKNLEGLLPSQNSGYYREFVHPTPGINGPGPQRIVMGKNGEIFYTPDHYQSFIKVNP